MMFVALWRLSLILFVAVSVNAEAVVDAEDKDAEAVNAEAVVDADDVDAEDVDDHNFGSQIFMFPGKQNWIKDEIAKLKTMSREVLHGKHHQDG